MKNQYWLLRREFWENKGAIFWFPVLMAAFICVALVITIAVSDAVAEKQVNIHTDSSISFSLDVMPEIGRQLAMMDEGQRSFALKAILYSVSMPFIFTLLIVLFFYALAALYDDRKDRSFLFWKSLPISDTETVASKWITILLVAPLISVLTVFGLQLFLMIYITLSAWVANVPVWNTVWAPVPLLDIWGSLLAAFPTVVFWLAPLYGFVLLCSAIAKRSPFVLAVVGPIALGFVEMWTLHEPVIIKWMVIRQASAIHILSSPIRRLENEDKFFDQEVLSNSLDGVTHAWQVWGTADFWIGIGIAAFFTALCICLRRYREEV